MQESLDTLALKQLSSLPVLTLFVAKWLAVSTKQPSTKRKLEEIEVGDETKEDEGSSTAEVEEDEDEEEKRARFDLERYVKPEDPTDPSLP